MIAYNFSDQKCYQFSISNISVTSTDISASLHDCCLASSEFSSRGCGEEAGRKIVAARVHEVFWQRMFCHSDRDSVLSRPTSVPNPLALFPLFTLATQVTPWKAQCLNCRLARGSWGGVQPIPSPTVFSASPTQSNYVLGVSCVLYTYDLLHNFRRAPTVEKFQPPS